MHSVKMKWLTGMMGLLLGSVAVAWGFLMFSETLSWVASMGGWMLLVAGSGVCLASGRQLMRVWR